MGYVIIRINDMNRNGIIKHIELHIAKMGSASAVAKKVGVSDAAISTLLAGKYGAAEAKMLNRFALALGYKERNWVTVRTITNYNIIRTVFEDAKSEAMWFAVSNKAGSGKTETLEDLYNLDETGSVTFIQAEEWSGRQFLLKLVEKTVGLPKDRTYRTVAQLTDMIVNYFNDMGDNPILIIDEADKLKASALRLLIPIYNKTEHRLGAILAGTENLQKEIQAGVRCKKKGYDEIESRFGRTYIALKGATEADVKAICGANGIEEPMVQDRIWQELDKVSKQAQRRTNKGVQDVWVEYCEDFRRLMRLIKRERLKEKRGNEKK